MNKLVILHGTMGSPEGNWFRWLEAKLKKKSLETWVPWLPHAEQPSLSEWLDFVKEECPFEIDEDTIVVGHSSGAILALLLAQENGHKVGKVICVSVFHDNSLEWDANARLFDVTFDWMKIQANVSERILCIHSDDDPYVPLDQAKYVADSVGAEMIVVQNQGHFNLEKSPEYSKFPLLLELLEQRKIV
jgi:predicted alpha/beta hydrolase family esterase